MGEMAMLDADDTYFDIDEVDLDFMVAWNYAVPWTDGAYWEGNYPKFRKHDPKTAVRRMGLRVRKYAGCGVRCG